MRMTKFLFVFCLILLLALFANGAYILLQPDESTSRSKPSPISFYGSGLSEDYEFRQMEGSTNEELPVNILVCGLDAEETRSDVILLFNFEPGSSRLNILSIARDTLVCTGGRYYKINALYSKGGEQLLAQKITDLTGLPVHFYITMDFEGFRKIVDTLGGVRFDVPFRMSYDDPTQDLHIHLRKGTQVLNGEKAEQLVRYRKGNAKGQGYTEGDIGRIRMQQDFIKALVDQKLNFRYISRAGDIFAILKGYVKTNIVLSDIAQYLSSIRKIESDEIKAVTLPGTSKMIEGAWYIILDKAETKKIIENDFYR